MAPSRGWLRGLAPGMPAHIGKGHRSRSGQTMLAALAVLTGAGRGQPEVCWPDSR